MTTLYHGAHTAYEIHEGQCYTVSLDAAERFAGSSGVIATVEIDLDALVVEECAGYDHDENYAPADDASFRRAAAERGVDVLTYDDEDEMGQTFTCYRLVSDLALAAVRVVEVQAAEDLVW